VLLIAVPKWNSVGGISVAHPATVLNGSVAVSTQALPHIATFGLSKCSFLTEFFRNLFETFYSSIEYERDAVLIFYKSKTNSMTNNNNSGT
jgi:hypothetical protein